MDRIFRHIYSLIKKQRILFFTTLLIFVAGCLWTASRINFSEDITQVLPKNDANSTLGKVMQQLDFSDKIIVLIEAKNKEQRENLSEIADFFIDTIQQDSVYYKDIQGSISASEINETFEFTLAHLPLFLASEDYPKIEQRLSKDSIRQRMEDNYKMLISPSGLVARDFILKDPLGLSFIGLNKLRELGISKELNINNGYLTTEDGNTILLFINPTYSGTDNKHNLTFINHLYGYQEAINNEFAEIGTLSYFGAPFISIANEQQIKQDIQRTVVISLTILMVLLVLFFKRLYLPIILFLPALCGVSLALFIMYLLFPAISAISIGIGAILLGITVDYPLHIITHYREDQNIDELFKHITQPVLSSSTTTSIAFLCLFLVNSEVLQNLGIFAAISIFASSVFALLIIPQLYTPSKRGKDNVLDRISAYPFERNKVIIGITLIATIFGLFTFSKVQFNDDIAALNFMPENMKASEQRLEAIGSMGKHSVYLTVYGENMEEIIQKNTELERKLSILKSNNQIDDYSSIGQYFLSQSDQQKKIKQWDEFWKRHGKTTLKDIQESAQELGFKEGTFASLDDLLFGSYPILKQTDFDDFSALPIHDFFTEKNGFYTLSTLVQLDDHHDATVLNALESDNTLAINRKYLNEQFLGQIKDDFKTLIDYSYIAILFILFLLFSRIELALISIIPITLTGFITMGIVYASGMEINIFSSVVTTLVLGLGVDFSVFITSGLQRRYTFGETPLKTYRTSILLAILTTILAIGVLVFAKHPALKSISTISNIGLLVAMFVTFSLYPLLFHFFFERRVQQGKSPITLRLLISAIISHSYYAIGSLLYSAFGTVFVKLLPIKKEIKLAAFRKKITQFIKTVMYSNYGVSNTVLNPHNEDFSKPAIIIANHTSFLDTLSMGFLTNRLIYMVNDWVYNSPIFGKAVRLAGYFPVSMGLENSEEQLVERIKQGYSLVVFPEGTRSTTNHIGRFHKGAFALAQKYNIDIVPVYIHGNADLLPKGDFIIFDGSHTLEIGKRITFDETQKEVDLRDITKSITKTYKSHFQDLRYRIEDENYFRKKIELSFLYKNKPIIKQAKEEFEDNKTSYHQLNPYIPPQASILRFGDDLGIWDSMLTLQQAMRKVFTYIENDEKRSVAEQNYLTRVRNISYLKTLSTSQCFDTLLITADITEQTLNDLLSQHNFSQVVINNHQYTSDVFVKFGYQEAILNGEDLNSVAFKIYEK